MSLVSVAANAVFPYISFPIRFATGFGQYALNNIAWGVSQLTPSVIEGLGYVLDNAPSIISAGTFSYLTFRGGKMVYEIRSSKDKWIDFENRFHRKSELKVKPINLGELLKKETSSLLENSIANTESLVKDKKSQAEDAQKTADEARDAANKLADTQQVYDQAKQVAATAQNKVNVSQQAYDKAWNAAQNPSNQSLDELEAIVKEKEKELNQNIKAFNKLTASVTEKEKELNDLKALIDSAADLQLVADEAKKNYDSAEEQLKKIKEKKPEKEKEKADAPEHFIMNYTVETTKPKDSETQFFIPFSDDALVIYHDNAKKVFTRAAAGAMIVGMSTLGLVDTLDLADDILPWYWPWAAKTVGLPVHFVANILGGVAGSISKDGIGKFSTTLALAYTGYKLYRSANLVWFNLAKGKPAPKIDTNMMIWDTLMLGGSAVAWTAASITFNDFIGGK